MLDRLLANDLSLTRRIYGITLGGENHKVTRRVSFFFSRAKKTTYKETEACSPVSSVVCFAPHLCSRSITLTCLPTYLYAGLFRSTIFAADATIGVPVLTWSCVRLHRRNLVNQNQVTRMAGHRSRRQDTGKDYYGCESSISASIFTCKHLPSFAVYYQTFNNQENCYINLKSSEIWSDFTIFTYSK